MADGTALSTTAQATKSQRSSVPVDLTDQLRSSEVSTGIHLSRAQILDATESCLREFGYDATTIRRIAGRLGCAIGSIYRYFPNKRAILSAVIQRWFEPVELEVRKRAPVWRTARMYGQIAAAEPEQYRLMFWLTSVADARSALPLVVSKIIEGWAQQLGSPRTAQRLWAQLHGCVMLSVPMDQLIEENLPVI